MTRRQRSIRIISSLSAIAIATAALILYICRQQNVQVYSMEFPAMGTAAKISVYSGENELISAFRLCKTQYDAVEKLCSLYDRDSELSRLNASAAEKPFVCSEDMWLLLMRAKQAYLETCGVFDISVKPLMDLWGFYRKQRQTVPGRDEISITMGKTGFDKLVFNEAERSIFFSVPGMALDMGGIAKGYALDRAAEVLKKHNILTGVIDLGGNLRMLSQAPPGEKFYTVAIKDPANKDNVLPYTVEVPPGRGVSTSGDYERFVIIDNKNFGHIISPETGYPVTVSAVTVIAETAMEADIFSTACSAGGEKTAEKLKTVYKKSELQILFTR